ncbi:MAG: hypothetical protein AB7U05_09080 [Mangrovibacterium sp.]
MSKPAQLCEAQQQELLRFFSPTELPTIRRHLKDIFRVAAFESDIVQNDGGQNALFTLYHLIEIIDEAEKGPAPHE